MTKNNKVLGNLAALYCVIIWGTTFAVTKILMDDFNPAEILFIRFLLAYIVLCLITASSKSERFFEKEKKGEAIFAGAALSGLVLYGVLEILSMNYTYTANTSTIVSSNPFFIGIFTMLFFPGEKPRWTFFAGFAIAMVGVAILSFNGASSFGLNPLGDILALSAAMTWGIYTVLVKFGYKRNFSTIFITRRIYLYGMILMASTLPMFKTKIYFAKFADFSVILSFLFLGVIASCTCFLAWNYATDSIGAIATSVYIYLIPGISILFGFLFLEEKINLVSVAGLAIVLAGTVLSSLKQKQNH